MNHSRCVHCAQELERQTVQHYLAFALLEVFALSMKELRPGGGPRLDAPIVDGHIESFSMLIGCLALPRLFSIVYIVSMHRASHVSQNVSRDQPTFSERSRLFESVSSSCSVPEHLLCVISEIGIVILFISRASRC